MKNELHRTKETSRLELSPAADPLDEDLLAVFVSDGGPNSNQENDTNSSKKDQFSNSESDISEQRDKKEKKVANEESSKPFDNHTELSDELKDLLKTRKSEDIKIEEMTDFKNQI